MNKTSQRAAEILLSIGAVGLNAEKPFRYTKGYLSPVYTDCRLLMSYPKERGEIIDLIIAEIVKTGEFDVIAGTATAGIPHAAWASQSLNLPMVYVRNKPKEHGKGNQIEGIVKEGQKVAVVEDMISTAQSAVGTILALRTAYAKADHIFSIMTYNLQKSQDILKENSVNLNSLTNLSDLSEVAVQTNKINEEQNKMVLEWAKDPETWGNRMGFE